MAMKYSLYQKQFDRLTYVLALLELGKKKTAYQRLMDYLAEDRGEFFDPKAFWKKVNDHKKEIRDLIGMEEE